jgi:2-isopropylmalate synthase
VRRIKIFDTTLRDGEQSPGIALSPRDKAELAVTLERLGVDVIEAGFAASSPGDFAGVVAVAGAVDRVTVASLARTTADDIDAAAAALAAGAGAASTCSSPRARCTWNANSR